MNQRKTKSRGIKQVANGRYHVQFYLLPQHAAIASIIKQALANDETLDVRTIVETALLQAYGDKISKREKEQVAKLKKRIRNAIGE